MSPENRQANAADEVRDSAEALRAAETLALAGLHRDAVERLYYAGFHLARALLFSMGLEPRSHTTVVRLLHKHFVRPARLDRSQVRTYQRLKESRENADYTTGWTFRAEDWEEIRPAAAELMETLRRLLRDAGIDGA